MQTNASGEPLAPHDIIVASSNDVEAVERTRLAALLSWRPAGAIIIPCTDAFATRDALDGSGVPHDAWMGVAIPPITAVRQPVERLGPMAWERLSARIAGERPPPTRLRLRCELVIRGSTRAIGPPIAAPDRQANKGPILPSTIDREEGP